MSSITVSSAEVLNSINRRLVSPMSELDLAHARQVARATHPAIETQGGSARMDDSPAKALTSRVIPVDIESELMRPLFVSSTGEIYMLLTHCKTKGDPIVGKGGYKKVKYAVNLETGEEKVVAVIRQSLADGRMLASDSWESLRGELKKELELMARFQGAGTFMEVDEVYVTGDRGKGEKLYMLMPYYRGGDLRHAIINQTIYGQIDVDEKLRMAEEAAQALACMHAQGIVHRDFKSENLCLDVERHIKLGDFGFSCEVTDVQALGIVQGTIKSLSPELADVFYRHGKHLLSSRDAAHLWATFSRESGDCWALGTVYFEMFSNGITLIKALHDHRSGFFPKFSFLDRDPLNSCLSSLRSVKQSEIDAVVEDYCMRPEMVSIIQGLLRCSFSHRLSAQQAADAVGRVLQTRKECFNHSSAL